MQHDTRGWGIIRLSFPLALQLFPLMSMRDTTMQRELHDTGLFLEIKERLQLPESYEIQGIYIEPYQLCWSIVVRSPDIPRLDEGALLPHCTPVYAYAYEGVNGNLVRTPSLVRMDIEAHDRILKVD